jgi:hypothetical protein
VASGLTLDTGALIAAEKHAERFWSIWATAMKRKARVTVPAAVVAQAWRGNRPVIARIVAVCAIEVLDFEEAKSIGLLLAKSRQSSDIVDAAVVVGAVRRGDAIATSDPGDIRGLLSTAGVNLPVLSV